MKTWLYLNNPFIIAATKSYRQGLKLSTFYDAQLHANISDPFFDDLYTNYHPLHVELSTTYSNWLAQEGTLKSKTLTVVQLLQLLSPTKVNEWEHAVTSVYLKGTPEYLALFPKGRKPFNSGSKELRIAGLKQFSTNLTGIVALAAVKIDVDNFIGQLTTDLQTQLGGKGTTKSKSFEVEVAIEIAATAMYGDFGTLITKFKSNPLQIAQYFDVETIRNRQQMVYNKTVKAEKVRNILHHTFDENDSITLINNGTVPLKFYLAPNKTAEVGSLTAVHLDPNTEQTFPIAALGDIVHPFLNVFNASIYDGHCTVEMT